MAPVSSSGTTSIEPHDGLGEALLAFQEEADKLKLGRNEDGQVGTRKYKYLTIDKLLDQVKPVLSKHGLVWSGFPTALDGKPALRYRIWHARSNEKDEDTVLLMLDNNNSQGQGSAITYSTRQVIMTALGLAPDDDDDGAAATSDERLMVSRTMDADEQVRMQGAIAEAGLDLAEVLATVDAASIEDVTLAQAHQIKLIIKLKGKASDG